jgi:flagellar motility protein MotE (MotC chaperone)
MIRVEGHKNLYRDEKSGAIVNCDTTSYNQYLNSLNRRDVQRKELDQMKSDIDEIKELLKELLNKK